MDKRNDPAYKPKMQKRITEGVREWQRKLTPEQLKERIEAENYIIEAGYLALPGAIPEKIAYRRASDSGRALTETRFATLDARSDELVQGIINLATKIAKAKVA